MARLLAKRKSNDATSKGNNKAQKRAHERPRQDSEIQYQETGIMQRLSQSDAAGFIGSASGLHFVRFVQSALSTESSKDATPAHLLEQSLASGEERGLTEILGGPTSPCLWHTHEVSLSSPHSSEVSYEDLIRWSQGYFDNWHPAYPFLHTPSVLRAFDNVSFTALDHMRDSLDPLELVMVRSILSISLADRRQSPPDTNMKIIPDQLVFQSYDAAIGSVERTLSKPASIRTIQAVISVQLFLISMLRYSTASRLGGLLLRMTFQLGLHRCPSRYTSFSREDIQMRKRIFWAVYTLDRHLSQTLGLPLGIRDDDVDVCYPDREKHSHKSMRHARKYRQPNRRVSPRN